MVVRTTLLLSILLCSPVLGQQLEERDSEFGPNTVTYDPVTELEWLDLDLSLGYDMPTMLSEFSAGGTFEGWRHATRQEVVQLWAHAGIPEGFAGDPAEVQVILGFQQTWGVTRVIDHTLQQIDCFGFTSTICATDGVDVARLTVWDWLDDAQPQFGFADFACSSSAPGQGSPVQGHCLIRVNNSLPVANAGEDQLAECQGALTPVSLDGTLSFDPDGDAIEFEWSVPLDSGALLDNPNSPTPSGVFPVGPTLVTLTVTDGQGGVAVDDVLVTVVDTTPPVLVCTTDTIALWPPDHSMRGVGICLAVADNCSNPEALVVHCTVSSNEPDDTTDEGNFVGDVNGADGFTSPVDISSTLAYDTLFNCYFGEISLRAERDGSANGRSYSIVANVLDSAGNLATASCVVVVPHDKRRSN